MIIDLFSNSPVEEERESTITTYLLHDGKVHPLVVVCPGGGYVRRADHEGEPVAKWLNSIGISAVVLHYRVNPKHHNHPLEDAKRAIRLARSYAKEWKVDPSKIGILGFSAGGHLAATTATHFDYGEQDARDEIDKQSSRPDIAILCYPVISLQSFMHVGSRTSLLGENPSKDLIALYSNELHVTDDTPTTFLWHTADDQSVPVENSYLYAQALSKHHVPHAMHIFESGKHGLGLASEHPEAYIWPKLCEAWLKSKGF